MYGEQSPIAFHHTYALNDNDNSNVCSAYRIGVLQDTNTKLRALANMHYTAEVVKYAGKIFLK